ncbi:hypothetical protein IQ07DRAFT_29744 [Pyrenochaeta sp. DS3sAY3a]|nr:hypothetical protein IQ07DRAFT_29744 [Pyrenochaeta sp. DS3sAY3a]
MHTPTQPSTNRPTLPRSHPPIMIRNLVDVVPRIQESKHRKPTHRKPKRLNAQTPNPKHPKAQTPSAQKPKHLAPKRQKKPPNPNAERNRPKIPPKENAKEWVSKCAKCRKTPIQKQKTSAEIPDPKQTPPIPNF